MEAAAYNFYRCVYDCVCTFFSGWGGRLVCDRIGVGYCVCSLHRLDSVLRGLFLGCAVVEWNRALGGGGWGRGLRGREMEAGALKELVYTITVYIPCAVQSVAFI